MRARAPIPKIRTRWRAYDRGISTPPKRRITSMQLIMSSKVTSVRPLLKGGSKGKSNKTAPIIKTEIKNDITARARI